MRHPIQDGHTLALRAIRKLIVAGHTAPLLVVEEIASRDWASATFVGQLHCFEIRLEGSAAAVTAAVARIEAKLPEVDVAMPGHLLAEAAVTATAIVAPQVARYAARLTIEALTLAE